MSKSQRIEIIAEIGINHNGSMDLEGFQDAIPVLFDDIGEENA